MVYGRYTGHARRLGAVGRCAQQTVRKGQAQELQRQDVGMPQQRCAVEIGRAMLCAWEAHYRCAALLFRCSGVGFVS